MATDKSICVLLGGLGLCASACLLAPTGAVVGTATFAVVAGGAIAGIGQALAPNIAADVFSRFSDWAARKLRDEGAAAERNDLRDLIVRSIGTVLEEVLRRKPGGSEGLKLLRKYKAAVRSRLDNAVIDDCFLGTWERTIPQYFKARIEGFSATHAFTPEIWKRFLNEGADDSLSGDEKIALDEAAKALHRDLPRHLVGAYHDALTHHPTVFVAVQTAILQEIWDAVSHAREETRGLREADMEILNGIRAIGECIARESLSTIQSLAQEFAAVGDGLRVLSWKITFLSRDTLTLVTEIRADIKELLKRQTEDNTAIQSSLRTIQRELVQELELVTGFDRLPDNHVRHLPTALLVASFGVIPYDDTRGIKTELLEWATDQKKAGVAGRLYVADAGYGKTRLGLEVVTTLIKAGWQAGLLPSAALERSNRQGAPDGQARLERFFDGRGDRGALLVVDYAEGRAGQIERVTRAALASREGSPIRIILLARSAAGWWDELLKASREIQLVYAPKAVSAVSQNVSMDHRKEFLADAMRAFAQRLNSAQSAGEALLSEDWRSRSIPSERVSSGDAGSPLSLAFEAFLHVRGVAAQDSPLEEMAREERRHWMRALGRASTGPTHLGDARLEATHRCAALLTLIQGTDLAGRCEVEEILDKVLATALQKIALLGYDDVSRAKSYAAVRGVVDLLYRRCMDGGDALHPIMPDLLGEYVVGDCLRVAPDLLAETLDTFPHRAMQALSISQRAIDGRHSREVKNRFVATVAKSLSGRVSPDMADMVCVAASQGSGAFLSCIEASIACMTESDVRNLIATNALNRQRLSALGTAITKRLLTFPTAKRSQADLLDTAREYAHSAVGLFNEGRLTEAIELNQWALQVLGTCKFDDERSAALVYSGVLANDANFRFAQEDWDGAIWAIENAKRVIGPFFLSDNDCTRRGIEAMCHATAIYRSAGQSAESLRNGAEAAKVAISVWNAVTTDALDYDDLELITSACINYANALLEQNSSESGYYYSVGWQASLAMNRLISGPQLTTMAVAYGRYLFLNAEDFVRAKEVFTIAAQSAQALGKLDLTAMDELAKLIRSIATCMHALNASDEEIDAMSWSFGCRLNGTGAGMHAQFLYNYALERNNLAATVPTPETAQAALRARIGLDEHIAKFPEDPFVQEVRRLLQQGEDENLKAGSDPVYIEASRLLDRWRYLTLHRSDSLSDQAKASDQGEAKALLNSLSELVNRHYDNPALTWFRNILDLERARFERLSSAPVAQDNDAELHKARVRLASTRDMVSSENANSSLPLAIALTELADCASESGKLDEAMATIDEAIVIFENLLNGGRIDAAAYFASAQSTLGDLLSKQTCWEGAAAAYALGAEVYRTAPAATTQWAEEVFQKLTHGFIKAATQAGASQSDIDRRLGSMNAIAMDPEELREFGTHHHAWVKAHNNSQTSEAVYHYARLIEALNAVADNKRLDPLRYSIINAVRAMGEPSLYAPLPKLPAADNTPEA